MSDANENKELSPEEVLKNKYAPWSLERLKRRLARRTGLALDEIDVLYANRAAIVAAVIETEPAFQGRSLEEDKDILSGKVDDLDEI